MDQSLLEALLDGPAAAPPPGKTSNLDNPTQYVEVSNFVLTLTIVVATLAVAVRMYTRLRITKNFDIADCYLLVGWALYAAFTGVVYRIGRLGPGIHQWDFRLRNLGPFLYWYHVGAIIYGLIICFVKLSILQQYIQIFMPTRLPKPLYWLTIFLMAANIVSYIIFTFIEIFVCSPIEKAWDPLVTGGHCLDILALNTASSGINTGSDFIILVIPQLVIWRLKMSWKNKTSVSIVFMVAILAIVSSAIRLYYNIELQRTHDLTYYSWLAGIWSLPEIMFGIVVACLPAFRSFLNKFTHMKLSSAFTAPLKKLTARKRGDSGQGSNGYILGDQNSLWPRASDPGQRQTKPEVAYEGSVETTSTDDPHLAPAPAPAPAIEHFHQDRHLSSQQTIAASEVQGPEPFVIFGGQPGFAAKSSEQISWYP